MSSRMRLQISIKVGILVGLNCGLARSQGGGEGEAQQLHTKVEHEA